MASGPTYSKAGSGMRLGRDVFSTGQVAARCGVSTRTTMKWVDTGLIVGHRMPGSNDRRVLAADLVAFLEAHGLPLGDLAPTPRPARHVPTEAEAVPRRAAGGQTPPRPHRHRHQRLRVDGLSHARPPRVTRSRDGITRTAGPCRASAARMPATSRSSSATRFRRAARSSPAAGIRPRTASMIRRASSGPK